METEFQNAFKFIRDGNSDSSLVSDVSHVSSEGMQKLNCYLCF